jgi:GNAT superfamily N-acetyltransferase
MADSARHHVEFAGYYPGVIGKITALHAVYYAEHWGFDVTFETQVGSELSEFLRDFDSQRDGFWVAIADGRFGGAVAIDGHKAKSEGARLRWFIVEPDLQGSGIGMSLLRKALDFCRNARYPRVYLWTFEGLGPARHLYEREGFCLAEEHQVEQWGARILEQKFELQL